MAKTFNSANLNATPTFSLHALQPFVRPCLDEKWISKRFRPLGVFYCQKVISNHFINNIISTLQSVDQVTHQCVGSLAQSLKFAPQVLVFDFLSLIYLGHVHVDCTSIS